MEVLIATPDLMTASRMRTAAAACRQVRTEADALRHAASGEARLVLIDLEAFPDLARAIRGSVGAEGPMLVGFAPHVRADVIAAARSDHDRVLSRGGAIRQLDRLVEAARGA